MIKMDYTIKAIIAIIIAATLTYLVIYVVPTLLPRLTYNANYNTEPTVIISSEVPGSIYVTTYNGPQIKISNVITYTPLIPRPSMHYEAMQTNNALSIQFISITCPREQFYPIYTCIPNTGVYLPKGVKELLINYSASIINIQVNNMSNAYLALSSSVINVKLENIGNTTLRVSSTTGVIKIQGPGNYSINVTGSSITIDTPPNTCIQINAVSSSITYPGGTIEGTGSKYMMQSTCITHIIVQSMSSTVSIN
ncbi:hypothetical protein GCM10007112_08390 [Vulcanisaeta souniana JCM 11219]|uniref:Adhesin domain-containing protein n=2 Tax=Vulcanisaeta souniana JCM 11219 TaxID=1293586 RepID=A0A830EG99_9CREN|nr:hypothetical protein GCM10007112_08390 [Vulcanisaeta souniana JCM 11219]